MHAISNRELARVNMFLGVRVHDCVFIHGCVHAFYLHANTCARLCLHMHFYNYMSSHNIKHNDCKWYFTLLSLLFLWYCI